uniref:Uncharacterized protein n=1 Tax=Cacopsylla melanoneura TaxID=428564 RepID=A0A8D8ZPN5_9HEMI
MYKEQQLFYKPIEESQKNPYPKTLYCLTNEYCHPHRTETVFIANISDNKIALPINLAPNRYGVLNRYLHHYLPKLLQFTIDVQVKVLLQTRKHLNINILLETIVFLLKPLKSGQII